MSNVLSDVEKQRLLEDKAPYLINSNKNYELSEIGLSALEQKVSFLHSTKGGNELYIVKDKAGDGYIFIISNDPRYNDGDIVGACSVMKSGGVIKNMSLLHKTLLHHNITIIDEIRPYEYLICEVK